MEIGGEGKEVNSRPRGEERAGKRTGKGKISQGARVYIPMSKNLF